MNEQQMSPRRSAAERIAGQLDQWKLAAPNGRRLGRHADGRYWWVVFWIEKVLDAQVNVYSENYVVVWWRTSMAGLPSEDKLTFGSADRALEFVRLAFVESKPAEAMVVPRHSAAVQRRWHGPDPEAAERAKKREAAAQFDADFFCYEPADLADLFDFPGE